MIRGSRTRTLTRRGVLAGLAAGSGAAFLGSLGCAARRDPSSTAADDPTSLDLREAARALRTGDLSPVELTRACLARIERLDPLLNSFITVTPDQAMLAARQAEHEIANGRWRGPLHGIPLALKDNIDTAGVLTTAGSAVFAARVPSEDAEVVRRLKRAGAVFLGKLNLHEFGVGATSAISHFGPVRNPWNLERVAGGSSGGPAAAVAAGLCFGALGTDTGGSIRIPAACCGVVGLKPTHGLVSLAGTIPMSGSFDHVGPLCRTVGDAAVLFGALTDDAAAHEFDPDAPASTAELRVGVLSSALAELCDRHADEDVQSAFDEAIGVIRSLVAAVRPAELHVPELGALIDADTYAYHATLLAANPEAYDPRTRAAILQGRDLSEAEVQRLRAELALHRASLRSAFDAVDLLIVPTMPEPAMALRDASDPFAQTACTFAFSIGGLPTISVPCGFSRSGLPIGLQISGPARSEPRIFALASAYECATVWHARRAPIEST